jgi:hypothetical protein
MSIRMFARIACLAVVLAEATSVATRVHGPSALSFGLVLVALQMMAVVWATDRRSSFMLRTVAPALLTAVTAAAVWVAFALAVPVIATGNTEAVVAIVAVGPVVAGLSPRSAGQRPLPLVLIASAGTALLIFLAVSCVLPMIPGFVSTNHPPTYTNVIRLVDPVGEFGIFILLALALGIDLVRARIRTGRAAAREQRLADTAGPNEMVVERADPTRRLAEQP